MPLNEKAMKHFEEAMKAEALAMNAKEMLKWTDEYHEKVWFADMIDTYKGLMMSHLNMGERMMMAAPFNS